MNTRNTLGIFVISPLLTIGTAAYAQGGPAGRRPGGMGQGGPPALPDSAGIAKIADEMAQALSLSADQKVQISALHFAHFAEVREQMDAERGDSKDYRQQMAALRTKFEKEVKSLLSDERQAKFEKLAHSRGRRPGQQGRKRR